MSKTKGTEDKLEKKCYCANTKKTVGNYNLKLSTKKVVENAIRICMQYKFFNVLYNEMEKMEGVPQQQRLNTTPPPTHTHTHTHTHKKIPLGCTTFPSQQPFVYHVENKAHSY